MTKINGRWIEWNPNIVYIYTRFSLFTLVSPFLRRWHFDWMFGFQCFMISLRFLGNWNNNNKCSKTINAFQSLVCLQKWWSDFPKHYISLRKNKLCEFQKKKEKMKPWDKLTRTFKAKEFRVINHAAVIKIIAG